jgi:hypothetical protein
MPVRVKRILSHIPRKSAVETIEDIVPYFIFSILRLWRVTGGVECDWASEINSVVVKLDPAQAKPNKPSRGFVPPFSYLLHSSMLSSVL